MTPGSALRKDGEGLAPGGSAAVTVQANEGGGGSPAAARSPAIDVLYRKWQTSIPPGAVLPPFEELALGSLGRMADSVALVESLESGAFELLRAGPDFEEWIGSTNRNLTIDQLAPECARPFHDVLVKALNTSAPAEAVAYGLRVGFVTSYDVLALPLANRWGRPLLLTYIQAQAARYSLIDAMFRTTREGLVALAAVRDAAGRPIDFQIVALNDGAAQLIGSPAEGLRRQHLSELFTHMSPTDALPRLLSVVDNGGSVQFELDYPVPTGGKLHLNVSASAMGDLLTVTLTDIGDLKARETSFRLLFEGNPVPMWVYDAESLRFLAVNDAAVAHYGYSRSAFLDMTLLDIRPPEDRDLVRNVVASGGDIDGVERLWRHVKADGTGMEALSYARAVTYQDRQARLVAVIDVTERRRAEARISHMAHHDALTDLPNRLLFRERLDEALIRVRRHDESLAILCLDLDHFKDVNDTLGHPIGDKLLRQVSSRLRDCLRESDVVARLGGDEFAIIQTGIRTPEDASDFAIRLVDLVGEPYDIDGHHVIIGASVGIAVAPNDGDNPDRLLKNADMALYRAKGDGRGTFRFFEPEMDARVQARRALELDLRKALVAGEFEIYYQPLVNLREDAVTGFEALLRWKHPVRGMVSPADFIPLAEEIGLIVPLGEWVLRQACSQAATWPDHVKVAVNLSPVQFKSRNLLPAVMLALASSGLSAARLELEITESVLLSESEANLATLHQLRALGVRISMDDFGTGYSSLSYLRTFPFDKIKIDQSFVRELAANGDCMAIVRAVAGLGSSLGIPTTAEGVETNEQLEWLRSEGCTEVQGYLFSPPRPAEEIGRLLAGRKLS